MDARVFVAYTEAGTRFGSVMITKLLEGKVKPISWQNAFSIGKSIYGEVVRKPYEYDFGVFVFSPEDFHDEKGRILNANLAFELGLFIGVKGRTRSFLVWPRGYNLPSDLQGIIHLTFDPGLEPGEALAAPRDQILAQIKAPPAENLYFMLNKKTGHCVDVQDWEERAGNQIILWRYHGGTNQLWSMERHEDNWFRVAAGPPPTNLRRPSNLCLEVAGASTREEACVELGLFNGEKHQQWSFTRMRDGAYMIKARHSRKVLSLRENGPRGRCIVVQRTWKHRDNRLWWIAQEALL